VEQVVIDWQQDADAQRLYVEIRQQSVTALKDIEAMRQAPGEGWESYNNRRSQVTQHFWTMFQRLRQTCLHPWLVQPIRENPGIPRMHYTPDSAFLFPTWLQQQCLLVNKCLLHLGLPLYVRNLIQTHFAQRQRYEIQPSSKMSCIMALVKQQAPKKVVVVSQFRVFLETIVAPWLVHNGVGCILFAGGTRAKQQNALLQFHENSDISVLLVVKSAGATGLK
jgi:SNF2 family DNA or RNA helicase